VTSVKPSAARIVGRDGASSAGKEDPIVPAKEQSIPFAKALRDAGATVTEVGVPNVGTVQPPGRLGCAARRRR
jgi:predicted esterase